MHRAAPDIPTAGTARFAGSLYLIIVVLGVTAEGIIRGPMLAAGSEAQVASRIADALPLFRLAMLGDLVMALADVMLAVVFYGMFRAIDSGVALAAMVFRLVQASIIGGSLILLVAAARLAESGEAEFAALFASLHGVGYDIGLTFFGVNALLLSWLVRRSGWLHPAFGWGLGAAGIVYLAGSALAVAAPGVKPLFAPAYVIPLLAESALCLRLLIGGSGRSGLRGRRATGRVADRS